MTIITAPAITAGRVLLQRRPCPFASWSSSSFRALHTSSLPKRIVFGSCSCQTEDLGYWDTIVAQHPDLTLLLGDNVYGGKSLDSLKNAYQALGSHASFQRARSSLSILATLDDNDYGNGGDACGENPNKDAAKHMFLDFWNIPKSDDRWKPNRGVYTSLSFQNKLQILMLDVRYHKSAFLETNEPLGKQCHVPDYESRNKTMLGNEQWEWLESELNKPFQLRFVVSPLQVLAEGHGFECWRMLPYERERLLSSLHRKRNHTLILSGDRHVSAFYQQPGGLTEVTSSSLTHTVPPGLLNDEVDATRLGDFVYCNNFGQIDINWDRGKVEISIRTTDTGEQVASKNVEIAP